MYAKIIKQDRTSGDLEDFRGVLMISQHYPKLVVVDSEFSKNITSLHTSSFVFRPSVDLFPARSSLVKNKVRIIFIGHTDLRSTNHKTKLLYKI